MIRSLQLRLELLAQPLTKPFRQLKDNFVAEQPDNISCTIVDRRTVAAVLEMLFDSLGEFRGKIPLCIAH